VRVQRPEDALAALAWFDMEIMTTLRAIVGMDLTDRAKAIARLAVKLGGLGLRAYVDLADFAHACVKEKGAQKAETQEMDQRHAASLYITLCGSC